MSQDTKDTLGLWVVVAAMALWLFFLSGCRSVPPSVPLADVRAANAGADAYVDAAQVGVTAAKPHADTTGKAILGTVDTHLDSARGKIGESDAAVEQLRRAITATEKDRDDAHAKYDRLEQKWYVRWGRRIEVAFWVIVFGWALLGVTGIVLTCFGGGWWLWIGRHLLNLLPFANLFAGAARLIETRQIAGKGKQ